MIAARLHDPKQPLQVEELPLPAPAANQALVQIRAAALNRRDYWITQGLYPGLKLPCTLGADGAGVVQAVGDGVDAAWVDREVIMNPGIGWGDQPQAQHNQFHILGMPTDGTFASHVCVPSELLYDKPAHLDWTAAALPLAGVTAYRAVFTQGQLQAGQTMLVNGIGGGVATFALQYGVAAGAKVVVTSSKADKLAQANRLGAVSGFNYTDEHWHEGFTESHGGADLIIDSAGGSGFGNLLEVANPGGRIVSYGATAGPPPKLDMFKVFWKQLQLIGSTMGSPDDFAAMVHFVQEHKISPIVDQVYPLAEVNGALQRMAKSQQFGKLVLEIAG